MVANLLQNASFNKTVVIRKKPCNEKIENDVVLYVTEDSTTLKTIVDKNC